MSKRPTHHPSNLRLDVFAFLFVAALWLALIALAHSSGDFPLNDDCKPRRFWPGPSRLSFATRLQSPA